MAKSMAQYLQEGNRIKVVNSDSSPFSTWVVYLGNKQLRNVFADAPSPALPRQFPPGPPVPGVVHHATHHHPPEGDPGGSAQHQSEPGQLHQGLNSDAKTWEYRHP